MDMSPIVERVRNLLNRTVENGCTEAEAEAAARLAGKLLDRYGLDPDVVARAEARDMLDRTFGNLQPNDGLWSVLDGVERYCGVRSYCYTMTGNRVRQLQLFGLPQDVEVAVHLLTVIAGALKQEGRAYLKTRGNPRPATRRRIALSFRHGMAMRLSDRLMEMAQARAEARPTGNALVVVKGAKVDAAFSDQVGELKPARQSSIELDGQSMAAGHVAGGRVRLTGEIS